MPEPDQTRERGSQVTSDVTEPLDKIAEVIEGLAAKNATMKDGAPEGGGGGSRAPTATEERVAAYEKYKGAVEAAWDKHTASDGTIADPAGLTLDVGQAIADLGVATGAEAFQLFSDFIGKVIPD